jgi:hypothetical protein
VEVGGLMISKPIVPRNIFIYAQEQKTLMAIDIVFPGWMMWRRLALAQDVPPLAVHRLWSIWAGVVLTPSL